MLKHRILIPAIWIAVLVFCALSAFAQVDTAWVRRYNGPGNGGDEANAIAIDGSGNVYVTGYSIGNGTDIDYATIKYYSNGDTAWVRRYNGPGNYQDGAHAIAVDDSGNVYVTGHSIGNGTQYDYVTIKYYPNGDTAWVRRYNGPGNGGDLAYAIAVDDSGNVVVTGSSWDSETDRDYATIKYDTNGNELWAKRYNGPGNWSDEAWTIAVDDSGNIYVTGQSWGGFETSDDYATIKYYPNGGTAWVRRYNGPVDSYDMAFALAVDNSGNVCVTGTSNSGDTATFHDYATIKYDPHGNELWVRRYAGQENAYDEARAIAVDDSGNVYVTGMSLGWHFDYATIKYSPNGNELWVRRYNGPLGNYEDCAHAIALDGFGNVYVTGYSHGSGTSSDYTTIKYDSSGNELWVRRYNGPGNYWDIAYAIASDDFGNVYVTGYSYGTGTGRDYASVKYDSNGNQLWVQRYNGPGNYDDCAYAITLDDFGNVYVTGYSYGSGTGRDYTTIKYDSSGNQLWVERYNGPGNNSDEAFAIAVDISGDVCVTGRSELGGPNDYATVKYVREWTILVYLNGDNDLEEFIVHDVNEMEMVGSSAQVSIVVQVDRIPGYDSSNGDWTDTRRYYITQDTDTSVTNSIRIDSLSPLGELNMGDPQTLVDFVNWGIDHYPANHYAVVVVNHGYGWYKGGDDDLLFKGVSDDWTDHGVIGISDGEWESAMSEIKNHLGRKIDLVGLDACHMQMWEVMDVTDDYADYMVGSEEFEWARGWSYDQFLSALTTYPTMSPERLGKEIVDATVIGGEQPTQSCVNLSQVPLLTVAVDSFASKLLAAIEEPDNYAIVHGIRLQLDTLDHEFGIHSHIDLYDFADSVYEDNRLPNSLRSAADTVRLAVGIAVTWNGGYYSWANGIAVYYPADPDSYDSNYDYLPVALNTSWDEFISWGFTRGDANGDGEINLADAVYLVNYLFIGGPPPDPLESGDANSDGEVNLADAVYIVNYLFIGGPPPGCE